MRVLVTGSQGFMGKNLVVRLAEKPNIEIVTFTRSDSEASLVSLVHQADAVVHLAGENRSIDADDFIKTNTGLTKVICDAIKTSGRKILLIFVSSIHAKESNPYGKSKRAAELVVEQLWGEAANPVVIFRLPNTFGKWSKPNYNSVVATFSHHIANDLPIQVHDPDRLLTLVYIDDVISEFLRLLESGSEGCVWGQVTPEYCITLGELAAKIYSFKNCRSCLTVDRVGHGLTRALYATYISFLPLSQFRYDLKQHADQRGVFVEVLKTPDCGQFSFFTAYPGVTRGGHYHHSKTEKFLVIKGAARFGFRHIETNETYELLTTSEVPQIVETIPGWTHDITNVGEEEMIVMLWASETFDRERPDTIMCKV